jgi:HAD superfamily hydrolase (TIGR01509 family)
MIDWIFWDNDGVLVDTEELYFRASRETLFKIGIDLSRDRFVQVSMIEGRSVFDLAKESGVDDKTVKALHDERNQRYIDLLKNGVVVRADVTQTLDRLKPMVSMGLVTSCREIHFHLIHEQTDLLPYFDFILTGDMVTHTKPDPEPYLKAIALSGCPPDRSMVVEDSVRGVRAAKAAGLYCLGLPNRLTAGCDFSEADQVIDDIKAVIDIVMALNRKKP